MSIVYYSILKLTDEKKIFFKKISEIFSNIHLRIVWQWNLKTKSEVEGLGPNDFERILYEFRRLHKIIRISYFLCVIVITIASLNHQRISTTYFLWNLLNMQNQLFPDEILLKIFSYLNYPDLGRCAQVSKKMQSVCFDESLKYHLMIDAYQNYSPFIKVLLQVTNFQKSPFSSKF